MITSPLFPKAVIFDWDNTLIDSCRSCLHAINAVFKDFNKPTLDFDQFIKQPSLSIKDYFKNIFHPHEFRRAESLYTHHILHFPLVHFEHSLRVLEWLKEKSIPLAIVSNKEGSLLRKEILRLGWENHFHAMIGSYDTPEDKPSPVPLLHALQRLKVNPGEDIWFVGDSLVDMVCARAGGCTPVAVGHHANLYDQPHVKAGTIQGVLTLLESLCEEKNPSVKIQP